ncbi:MAG: hypothetical protein HFJ48_04090 [Clostridia bacterium]|nr:hypothetical protein [Clostridia bacterium]
MISKNKIPKIEQDYKEGATYKQLAEKYKSSYNEIAYLIKKEKWQRKSNRSKALKGNQNAIGNSGGSAPEGNKNAVSTGEFEKIFNSVLDDEEQTLMNSQFIDTRMAIQHELKLISIREKRMLNRIQELKEKNRDLVVTKMKKNSEDTSTEAQNTLFLINKIEEGLTRVQESKRRMLDLLYKIESKEGKYSDKGKSLADEIQAAYDERVGDSNVK